MVAHLRNVGIALLSIAILILFLKVLLLGVAFLILLVAAFVAWEQYAIWNAAQRFRRKYRPVGKDVLLVYSNSLHWQSYVESNWLPRWATRAVVLNWSERSTWERNLPEVAVFHAMAGQREYNPLAIVIPEHGKPALVRFWKAFRDHKHGKDQNLKQQELELERLLAVHPPPGN